MEGTTRIGSCCIGVLRRACWGHYGELHGEVRVGLMWQEFPSGPASSIPAFMLGAALTTVLFLSLIGFTLRRTNVLETSLVFVYVVVRYIFN